MWEQLRKTWQTLGAAMRFLIVLVVFLTALGIGVLVYSANRVDYVPVAGDFDAETALTLADKLQARGIPFRYNDDQTVLLVPKDQFSQARAEIAVDAAGNATAKGFELFDETPLGSTPFTQHVNYQRALQNELARSISQIDGIAGARVHIVRSEPTPFLREQKPTTASVVVRLKPGAAISQSTSQGIVSLVSRAVEGLSPEHVTLMDQHGQVLSGHSGEDMGHTHGQLEAQSAMETHLARKAESMLEKVLGKGRAIVRVTASLNFQKFKEKRETYEPESRVVLSERVSATRNQQGNATPRGMPGYASNLPNQLTTMALRYPNTNNSQNQEETNQTEYGVSKRIQELEDKPGSLDRLTIAALIDMDSLGQQGLGIEEIREIIKQAVGFRMSRDEIRVTSVKMPRQGIVAADNPKTVPQGQRQGEATESPTMGSDRPTWLKGMNLESVQEWLGHIRLGAILTLGILTLMILVWMVVAPSRYETVRPPFSAAGTEKVRDLGGRNPEDIARGLTVFLSQ